MSAMLIRLAAAEYARRLADLLIPPDGSHDSNERLIYVNSLFRGRLNTLRVEALCEVSALCKVSLASAEREVR